MNTPGDWIGWGILVCLIGGVATAAAWAVTGEPIAAIAGIPVGFVGGALIQVGLIGRAVSLGLRHAEGAVSTSRPTTSVRTGQPDPNLPPWDQLEGRSYR